MRGLGGMQREGTRGISRVEGRFEVGMWKAGKRRRGCGFTGRCSRTEGEGEGSRWAAGIPQLDTQAAGTQGGGPSTRCIQRPAQPWSPRPLPIPRSSCVLCLSDSGCPCISLPPPPPTAPPTRPQAPRLSNRICPGARSSEPVSLYISHRFSASLSLCPPPQPPCAVPFSESQFSGSLLPFAPSISVSPHPVSVSPPTPNPHSSLCLCLCVSLSQVCYLQISAPLSISVPPHPGPSLPPWSPYSHSGRGWRGGVGGGRCSGSCVFPAQNRLPLPWRRERGLRDAKHQAGG